MKKNKGCDLQSCFMCRSVLNEWKLSIENHRKNFLVKKGETIIKEGDPVSGVYFVNTGKIKVHKQWGDKELIVRFASNGAIFGHRGLSTKSAVFPVSATALEATSVCYIDLDFFMSTLKVNTEFALHLLMFFADELQESERKMRNLAHMSVKGRLAMVIIQLKEQFGLNERGYVNIELSRQDIAAFAGTTYETIFRMMNELVREDLISVNGKWIGIKDSRRLKALTEQ